MRHTSNLRREAGVWEIFIPDLTVGERYKFEILDGQGSVLAQKLLFSHSSAGDLSPLLRWYFDTSTGGKTDPASYSRIAATVGARPADILFISDVVRELDTAREAGMRTALCIRPGNPTQPAGHEHPVLRSLQGAG